MKKMLSLILTLLTVLAALPAFAEELPVYHQEERPDFEAIIANIISGTDYVQAHSAMEEGCVAIPSVVVYKTREDGPQVRVYGIFSVDVFRREDSVLRGMNEGGNEKYGVITLEKTADGWKITDEDYARNTHYFAKEAERIADGDEELLGLYLDAETNGSLLGSAFYNNIWDYVWNNGLNDIIDYCCFPGSEGIPLYKMP